jgi:multicomponent Na+:H+ antiporter subunit E
VFVRFLLFLALWLVFDEGRLAGLVIGLPAAALSAWLSLRLQPASRIGLRPGACLSFGWHFIRNSVVAGGDVALRAFHPKLPLQTGFVTCDCRIPTGPGRDFFLALSSLMPGSLPVEEGEGGLVVLHCLDTRQPQAAQMADNEARLRRALGEADA